MVEFPPWFMCCQANRVALAPITASRSGKHTFQLPTQTLPWNQHRVCVCSFVRGRVPERLRCQLLREALSNEVPAVITEFTWDLHDYTMSSCKQSHKPFTTSSLFPTRAAKEEFSCWNVEDKHFLQLIVIDCLCMFYFLFLPFVWSVFF